MRKMSLKKANQLVDKSLVKITQKDGEYRVAFTYGTGAERELSAYYTDDIADALGTARHMAITNGHWNNSCATLEDAIKGIEK